MHHLWISHEWNIPVNDIGRCEGICAEGALGFVVQLEHFERADYSLALKIPKLTGETHRENAYINDLMEKELHAVEEVFHQEDSITECLLTAIPSDRGPMRGKINTQNGLPEAQKWHEAIILVNFEKGKNPRFCLVKSLGESGNRNHDQGEKNSESHVEVFPSSITDCPITTASVFAEVEKLARSKDGRPWKQTVFIEARDSQYKPSIFTKEQALRINPTGITWFTCIPSVKYHWAPGTLQEAISLNKRGNWDVSKHFSLAQRICKGIYALHRNNMLHADLRPANIAYRGRPTKPDRFVLCDYGSFADIGARAVDRPTGGTVLGPVAGTERTSVFYAPERRTGKEREAADTAVILNTGPSSVDIVLGWQSRLRKNPNDRLEQNTIQSITELSNRTIRDDDLSDALFRGDRIQIRDYIFDVIKAQDLDDRQFLICKPRAWKIYQGRIVVENTDRFSEEHWVPIPKTVELQQWSAATDLYSLGVLFLYSVYRNEIPRVNEEVGRIEEQFREMLSYLESRPYFDNIWPEIENLRQQLEENLDNSNVDPHQFAEQPFYYSLFRIGDLGAPLPLATKLDKGKEDDAISQFVKTKLSSETLQLCSQLVNSSPPPDFLGRAFKKALVSDINRLLKGPSLLDEIVFQQPKASNEVRALASKNPKGQDLVRLNRLLLEEFFLTEGVNGQDTRRQESFVKDYNVEENPTTLKQKTTDVVRRITQTVPWSRRLVHVFDFNLGAFIFFIHFVVCCLHRRNHLVDKDGWNELPFCENRIEPPGEHGGAERAVDRLEKLQRVILDNRLLTLKTTSNAIPEFDPRPDPLIRAAYYLLSEKAKEVLFDGQSLIDSASIIVRCFAPFHMKKMKLSFSKLHQAITKARRTDLIPIDSKATEIETKTM